MRASTSADLGRPRKQNLRMVTVHNQAHCGLAQGMDRTPDRQSTRKGCEGGGKLEVRPLVFGLRVEDPKEGGQGSYQCGCYRSHIGSGAQRGLVRTLGSHGIGKWR